MSFPSRYLLNILQVDSALVQDSESVIKYTKKKKKLIWLK
jgi:hypothetical protein